VQLPVLGELRLKECNYLPIQDVRVLSATVSEQAGRWYLSLQVEQEIAEPKHKSPNVVGIDVGIKCLATTSDGEIFNNPKALVRAQRSLRSRQKAVSRKVKGSSNRRKAVKRVARLHQRISNIRKDAIHKMTTAITKSASIIVIETLSTAGMMKNHCLARALSDASLSEIHRQLKYKAKWYGVEIVEADRFYPSSKTCSCCGNVKASLSLGERTYCCEVCGFKEDRDVNAATNLRNLAVSSTVDKACCPESAGSSRKARTKLLVGQEPSRLDSAC
jgi:putative transposase